MSDRHLFSNPDGLVVKGLRGAVTYNTALRLIEDTRVVYDTTHSQSQVSIISGGGAGHEPAWAGYVGQGVLAASASGDIFASPSTKQVLSAVESVPSNKGTILLCGNYTGDCLHFGLACEKANALRKSPCGIIIAGDDVSVGKKGSMVGRRGLAGHIGILKIMGGAAATEASFDDCMSLGKALCSSIVSIASTLDHCHVPGRTEHGVLDKNEVELGTGPHNEPGYKKISPPPSPEEYIALNLKYILDESDPERGYVHFDKGDEIVLMVSNFGGMSPLELGALTDELLEQLDKTWNIQPVRVYNGPIETSLNAPAFSTSILNLTATAKGTKFSVEEMKRFLDARSSTQWESMAGQQGKQIPRREQYLQSKKEEAKPTIDPSQDLKVDPKLLDSMLRRAAKNIIAREPDLTKWDTVMGDGDCGETLKTGATSITSALDSGLASSGSCVAVLHEFEHILESKMGGTLGGILGIFFVSMTNALQRGVKESPAGGTQLWAKAVTTALENLRRYTPAAVGDRTVMDVFIPFAETMGSSGSFDQAVQEAVKAAEGTKKMTPRLGRATYVGVEEGKDLPPDPGAWGVMEAINGLREGMQGTLQRLCPSYTAMKRTYASAPFSANTHMPNARYQTAKVQDMLSKSILHEFPPSEAATRIELAAAYRLFHAHGWNESIENHLTAKVVEPDGSESFLINAHGLHYSEMTASSLVKLGLDGTIKHPGVTGDTFGINESGSVIHSAIHRARGDISSVMHCHFPPAAGVSATNDGLLGLAQTMHACGPIAYHDYRGLVVDRDEQESLVRDLEDANVYFLRNHGVVTAAESVSAAWYFMYQLLAACEIQGWASGNVYPNHLRVLKRESNADGE
ncbi:MAG: hypothetical protein M1831_001272 [Alyxoria varia]|nr:MAG: hypothetical protein M1831_001272 [Alyxoria varia]